MTAYEGVFDLMYVHFFTLLLVLLFIFTGIVIITEYFRERFRNRKKLKNKIMVVKKC